MTKKINIPSDNNILKIPLEEAMPENYLPYAVEVAKERALPDVRDGLKPVHRRILYGAYMLKAFPDRPYYKSARIVGDILGKYHPHGDASVYDSMVILAQKFSTRMPLIDGHGNWGSIDGDSPAAMRYTEARLTPIALEMLKDIDKDVVDMVDNYSGSEKEPSVLPSRYPNLLVNGSFGIAVGLATNIPPHNLKEVTDACIALIDNPDMTTDDIMNYVKGPDLPTGGIIIGKKSLLSAYETGSGKVTLRAKTKIEKLDNGRLAIVITEFPYRKNKAKILEFISSMTEDKKNSKILESISDIRDESDKSGIRAVIELKKSSDMETCEKLRKYLFKKTELQSNLPFNMVALAGGKPRTMGLKTILQYYIDYQKEIVTRRTKKELDAAQKRFHIVEGFIKAVGIMDDIIKVIRASKSKKDAQNNISKEFGFSNEQAEAIVELMLYKLTGLEVDTFKKEYNALEKTMKRLSRILESEKELLKVIKKELKEVEDKYGDDRRTEIIEDDEEAKINYEDIITPEDCMITFSNDGFIKMVSMKAYNRSSSDVSDIEYREGDFNRFLFDINTADSLILFTDLGNMYQVRALGIPECKWKEKGERIDTIIKTLDLSKEKIICVFSSNELKDGKSVQFITDRGNLKKTGCSDFITNYSKITALKLKDGEKVLDVKIFESERKEEYIKFKTMHGLEFTLKEPEMEKKDRNILGTQIFNLSGSDEVIEASYTDKFENMEFYLKINKNGDMTISKSRSINKNMSCMTDSASQILIFDETGNVYSVPSSLIQNIKEKVNLGMINDEYKGGKIIDIESISSFDDDREFYFFSKKGLTKKTKLSEFSGKYSFLECYRLKTDDDSLINVSLSYGNKYVFVVTKKGMIIRFDSKSVNPMGKVASGVNAINLLDDDEVIFGGIFDDDEVESLSFILSTNLNGKKIIKLNSINIQGRAGKGKCMMSFAVCEYLKEVLLQKNK